MRVISVFVLLFLIIGTIIQYIRTDTINFNSLNRIKEHKVVFNHNQTRKQTENELYQTASLSFQPQSIDIFPGEIANLIIQTENITDVFGIYVLIGFDPAILQVVDADPNQPGYQIVSGNCPQPDFVLSNIVDIDEGTGHYEVTQLNPTPPCSGGAVATVQFQCLVNNSTTMVTFIDSLIASPDGKIDHITVDAVVNCISYPVYLPFISAISP